MFIGTWAMREEALSPLHFQERGQRRQRVARLQGTRTGSGCRRRRRGAREDAEPEQRPGAKRVDRIADRA